VLNIDHVVPVSRGGSDRVSNLALACRTCNEAKGALLPEEWARSLKRSRSPMSPRRGRRTDPRYE
jgi:5-methylcytosine-specific restriction endonuclease McrA